MALRFFALGLKVKWLNRPPLGYFLLLLVILHIQILNISWFKFLIFLGSGCWSGSGHGSANAGGPGLRDSQPELLVATRIMATVVVTRYNSHGCALRIQAKLLEPFLNPG